MDNLIRLGDRFRQPTAADALLAVLRDGRDAAAVDFRTYEAVPEADRARLVVAAAVALGRPVPEATERVANALLRWQWDGIAWGSDDGLALLTALGRLSTLDPNVSGAVAVGIREAALAAGADGAVAASGAAARVLDLLPPGEHGVLDRFTRFHRLALAKTASTAHEALALEAEREGLADQPIALLELEAIAATPADRRFDLADVDLYSAHSHPRQLARRAAIERLGRDPDYAAAAERVGGAALVRLEAIHAGDEPYRPDRAFAEREVEAITRAHAVAAALDAPWLAEVVGPTFARLAVAPTAAKTVPSQSLIIRLAHEIADRPLPESVAALAAAAHDVRHAGVKKKLDHDLRAARKALVTAGTS